MNNSLLPTIVACLVVVAIVVGVFVVVRSKRKASRRATLNQRMRNITFHDQAKAKRLIEFEREELKRKGRAEESTEDLMARAIYRWERDNASASSIY